jgi:hypothetical protein
MGFRLKIVVMLSLASVLMLAQIIITLSLIHSMNANLKIGSGRLVGDLSGIIEGAVSEGAAEAMKADLRELGSLLGEAENMLVLMRHFFLAERHFAQRGAQETRLAVAEAEEFTLGSLKEIQESIYGLGATFEEGAFSGSYRHFLPYAYREEGKPVYSVDPELEGRGESAGPPSDDELRAYMDAETAMEYYALSIPQAHDRNTPAPDELHWTEPYVDYMAGEILISATRPINDEGKALGVVYVDLSLKHLKGVLAAMTARTQNSSGFTFSWGAKNILAAAGLPWEIWALGGVWRIGLVKIPFCVGPEKIDLH